MSTTADRLSGVFFLLFGLGVYFLVIPNQVEAVDGGNLSPKTMPSIVSMIIAICGGLLVFRPTGHQVPNARFFGIAAFYAALLAVGIYAMSLFGFEYTAPVLALAIMLVIGERRLLWLSIGAVVMPVAIWFLVTQLLERALP